MSADLFNYNEGAAMLDIVREYLNAPGDLEGAKRQVLGKLMDEAQAAMIDVDPLPDGVTPLRR